MALIETLLSRRSEPRLEEPAPSAGEVETLVACALRAPDHALLRPSRYWVVTGEARHRLGDCWARALAGGDPGLTQDQLDRARGKLLRAPMIIIGITRLTEHPKVPAIEQQLSTGTGLAYMLLGLQAMGYGAIWRTGEMAYHDGFHREIGLQRDERITGFLYVGTPSRPKPETPAPNPADHFAYWNG